MNYPPKQYQNTNKLHMIEVIKSYPLATLISVYNNTPLITHLPLVYQEDEKLIGHIDCYNPHVQVLKDNNPITIIFSGPQAYISPSLFTSNQLPTYNYIKVHLNGTVKAIENKSALKKSLIKMTEFLEHPEHKYVLNADNEGMERNLDYIKMFEITVTNWEGKFKLSQDKSNEDFELSKTELIRANQQSIELFLNKIFKNH